MNIIDTMAFQLKALKIPFEREYLFHPERKWRLDFAAPLNKIGIEVHGGIYVGGRHTRGKGFEKDREKMNEAQLLGWTVIEVTADHVLYGHALKWVERALGEARLQAVEE